MNQQTVNNFLLIKYWKIELFAAFWWNKSAFNQSFSNSLKRWY